MANNKEFMSSYKMRIALNNQAQLKINNKKKRTQEDAERLRMLGEDNAYQAQQQQSIPDKDRWAYAWFVQDPQRAIDNKAVRNFNDLYNKAATAGNSIYTNTKNGKPATQQEIEEYERTVNSLASAYDDTLFQKYYGEQQRAELQKGINAFRNSSSAFNDYYSDYKNTADYQNLSYEDKQKYLAKEAEEAKKKQKKSWAKRAGETAINLLAAFGGGDANTLHQQYDDSETKRQLDIDSAQLAQAENLRLALYNDTIKARNKKLLDNDKELSAYAKQAYDANYEKEISLLNLGAMTEQGVLYSNASPSSSMSQAEAQYYDAVSKIVGKGYTTEQANEIIEAYTLLEDERQRNESKAKIDKFSQDHPVVGSILENAAYVGANLFQAPAVIETVGNAAKEKATGRYSPLNTNTAAFAATNFRADVSEATQKRIEERYKELGRSDTALKIADFTYQTGLSIADFLLVGKTFGAVSEAASLAIMGTSAAASTAQEAAKRGLSGENVMWTALAAGACEILFEKVSLDNFIKMGDPTKFTNRIINALKSSGIEGTEEFFTDIGNAVTDYFINGDKAELKMQRDAFIAQYMKADPSLSYEEAKKKADAEVAKNFGLQLAESFAGGALSGFASAGTQAVFTGHAVSQTGSNILSDTNEFNALINTAYAMDSNSNTAKLLSKMTNGKSASNARVGELYYSALNDLTESMNNATDISELVAAYDKATQQVQGGTLRTAVMENYKQNEARLNTATPQATVDITDDGIDTDSLTAAERTALYEQNKARVLAQEGIDYTPKTQARNTGTNAAADSDGETSSAEKKAEVVMPTAEAKKNTFAVPVTIDSTGKSAVITSVHSTKNGSVRFTTETGRVVSIDDITANNSYMADIVNDAVLETKDNVALGANGASLYIQKALDANLNSKDYVAFKDYSKQAYLLGVGGANWGAVTKQAAGVISRLGATTARQFYDAGVADNNALTEIRESNKQKRKKTVQKRTGGKYENKTDNAELDAFLQRAAEKTHIDIVYNGGNDNNTGGEFKAGEGRAFINEGTNTRGDLTSYFHEGVGEALLAFNSADYRLISDSIINYLEDQNVITTNNDIRAYAEGYHEKQKDTTIRDAKNELTNDCIAALFTSEEGFKQYCEWLATDKNTTVNEKKTIIEKLKDLFNSLVEKFKDFVNKGNYSSSEQSIAEMEIKKADELRKQILSAMDTMIENLENGTEVELGKKNSINVNTADYSDYDKPITTEDIKSIKAIGRKNIINFTSEDIKASQKFAYKYFKQMGTKSPYFRAWFGEWRAYDTSSAIMATRKNTDAERSTLTNKDTGWQINVSRKTYKETRKHQGKKNQNAVKYLDYINDIVENAVLLNSETSNKDNVNSLMFHNLYAYTEVLGYPALLRLKVEELYDEKSQSTFNRAYILQNIKEEALSTNYHFSKAVSVDKTSSTYKIADLVSLVKSLDNEYSAKEVNKVFLNEDGTPKIFYHSTNADFTQFKAGRGILGNGMYFSDAQQSVYGKKVMPVYIRAENVVNRKELPKDAFELDSAGQPLYVLPEVFEKYPQYDAIVSSDALLGTEINVKSPNQIKSATDNIGTFDDSLDDIRYSVNIDTNTDSNPEAEFDRLVNTSMTMEDAKQMIQRAFVLGEISRFEPDYKNGDEWLKGEGVDMVALHIENEYALQQKYLNKIPAYLDGEIFVESILEAYQNGTLTGKEKAKAQRLDTSVETRVNDERFYSPQRIDNAVRLLDLADQKAVGKDKDNILAARAKIILFAHNSGAAELLGLTQTELNQKLRSWSGYNKKAADISKRLNAGVALANRWSGIENCSNLVKYVASRNELAGLVKSVEGTSSPYERNYITRTMLALDTHIDWSWLNFKFESHREVNNGKQGSTYGYFRHWENLIVVSHNAQHSTVAHEMGHALDYKWGNDLGFKGQFLTEVFSNTERINDPTIRQFFDNFKIFLDDITDSSDIRNKYTIDVKEVFARFVARFVEWTDNTASNNFYRERSFYDDKFTLAQFVEFARLLQEKSMLENTADERIPNDESRFSVNIDTDKSSLIKENKQLQKSLDYYKMMSKRNTGHKVSRSEIRRIAADLKNSWTSTMTVDEIAEELTALYDHISSGNATWGTIELMGKTLGKELVESSKSELDPETSEVRDYLKSLEISLDDYQEADVRYLYENMRTWINGIRKGVKYRKDGIKLDAAWQEMSSMYPYIFAPDTNSQDQPAALYEAVQELYSPVDNSYGYDDNELAEMIMLDIYDKYYDIPEVITPVDRANKKLNQERAESRRRLEEVKAKDKERYEKKIAEVKDKYDKNLDRKQQKISKLEADIRYRIDRNKERSENRRKSALRERILKDTNTLSKWLAKPNKENSVPTELQKPLFAFLTAINFTNEKAKNEEKMTRRWQDVFFRLHSAFSVINSAEDVSAADTAIKFPPNVMNALKDLAEEYEDENISIYEMSVSDLTMLKDTIAVIKNTITQSHKLLANERTESLEALGADTISEIGDMKRLVAKNSGLKSMLLFDFADATSVMRMLGDAGGSVIKSLRNAHNRQVGLISIAKNAMEGIVEDVDTKTWSGRKAELKQFNLEAGGDIALTPAQIMDLYLLSKRDQAKEHLLGGGITLSNDIEKVAKGKVRELNKKNNKNRQDAYDSIAALATANKLSVNDIANIVGTLTDEQKKVADAIQKFMSTTCAAWGNEITQKLYGYDGYTERDYVPIVSCSDFIRSMDSNAPDNVSYYAVANQGFTKATVKHANNPIVVGDLFEVFADHINNMILYNAYTIPLSDAMKWINFKTEETSIKNELRKTYGDGAEQWLLNLFKDLNGVKSKAYSDDAMGQLISRSKGAKVAFNARVAIQQPTAFLKASLYLPEKYMVKAAATSFTKGRQGMQRAKEHCPIALWKSWGFFDTNIGPSMTDLLLNRETGLQKLEEFGMKGAELGDAWTWGVLWNACEYYVQDTRSDLEIDSAAYYSAVSDKLSEIIDNTQVVDSPFHRTQIMRSKGTYAKLVTAFMAEPMKSYNMLKNATLDVIQGKQGAKKFALKTAYVYAITQIAVSAAAALVDGFRKDDEDDEKNWWQRYWKRFAEAFKGNLLGDNFLNPEAKWWQRYVLSGNLSPLGLLPFAKDWLSVIDGYDVSRMDMDIASDLINAFKTFDSDKATPYQKAYQATKLLSDATGLPISNATRTFKSVYNIFSKEKMGKQYADKERYKQLYDYKVSGDKKNYDRVYAIMQKNGKDDDSIMSGIKTAYAENDTRVAMGAIAYVSGDMDGYIDYINQIAAEYDEEFAKKVIASYANWLKNAKYALDDKDEEGYADYLEKALSSGVEQSTVENAIKGIDSKSNSDSDEAKMLYKWTDIYAALDSGQSSAYQQMYQDALDVKVANGKSKAEAQEEIKKKIQGYYKQDYIDNESKRSAIESKLNRTGLFSQDDYNDWVAQSFNGTENMKKAFEGGLDSTRKYVSDRVQAKVKGGMAEDSAKYGIRTSISNAYKQEFINGDANTRARIITYMANTGIYGSRQDVIAYINKNWLK